MIFLSRADSKLLTMKGLNTPRKDNAPLLQCTHHMCPVRVHWHVKTNYKDYWRVKIAITNFNYRMNHTLWTLAIQHPNLNNVTQVFSFDYKSVAPYGSISKSLPLSLSLTTTFENQNIERSHLCVQMILECSMERNSTMIF